MKKISILFSFLLLSFSAVVFSADAVLCPATVGEFKGWKILDEKAHGLGLDAQIKFGGARLTGPINNDWQKMQCSYITHIGDRDYFFIIQKEGKFSFPQGAHGWRDCYQGKTYTCMCGGSTVQSCPWIPIQ